MNKDIPVCPVCNAPTRARDSRKRLVKDSAGSLYHFQLRRLQCLNCGLIHIEIPDCIEPQKHYFKLTIARAIEDKKYVLRMIQQSVDGKKYTPVLPLCSPNERL